MVGEIYATPGIVKQHERFMVVKKEGKKGDLIPKHNHPAELILFTVVKGKVKVWLNDTEEHIVEPGKMLHFDGDNYINAEFLEDGELFVSLVVK